MPDGKTIAFFPEPGAWGPTNDCAAIGEILLRRGHRVVFVVDESFAGVLAPRGFEERLFRTAPPQSEAPSDGERRRRPMVGVHPRHRARVPQADDRADRDRDEADLGDAGRGRAVRARAADGDLGRDPPRRRGDRQRDRVSGRRAGRLPVGPHRLVQPARDARPRPAAAALRPPRRGPRASGTPSARSTPGSTTACCASTTSSAPRWACRRARRTSSTRDSPWLNLYEFPEAADYAAAPAARADVAPHGLIGARRRGAVRRRRRRCRATARSSTCRWARSAAWTSA